MSKFRAPAAGVPVAGFAGMGFVRAGQGSMNGAAILAQARRTAPRAQPSLVGHLYLECARGDSFPHRACDILTSSGGGKAGIYARSGAGRKTGMEGRNRH
jgi:hypothetical protein